MAGGRPTKYKSEFVELAYNYCLLGAIDTELATFFDVDVDTIHRWKKDHPEFYDSIKKGKAYADAQVASKLYHRANGYEHPEDDIKVCDKEIVITATIKHYPPDTTACIFWLKNRQPEKWRDKQVVESENNHTVNLNRTIVDGGNQP